MKRMLLTGALLLAACENEFPGEIHVDRSEIHRVVSRQQFEAIAVGAIQADVKHTLGEPEAVDATTGVWRYRIWDGDEISTFRSLFRTHAPRGRQLFGDLVFRYGRVTTKSVAPVPGDPFAKNSERSPSN